MASASLLAVDALGSGLLAAPAGAAGETPQDVLAAQIRLQGFTCDKALGAVMQTPEAIQCETVARSTASLCCL